MTEARSTHGALWPQAVIGGDRGSLVAVEGTRDVPFQVARVYWVFGTPVGEPRGFHAHRTLRQWAVCVSGSCSMLLDNGATRTTVTLDDPAVGVMIEPMVWHEMHEFTPGTVLLVLADQPYDEGDYIRDERTFRAAITAGSPE